MEKHIQSLIEDNSMHKIVNPYRDCWANACNKVLYNKILSARPNKTDVKDKKIGSTYSINSGFVNQAMIKEWFKWSAGGKDGLPDKYWQQIMNDLPKSKRPKSGNANGDSYNLDTVKKSVMSSFSRFYGSELKSLSSYSALMKTG